MSSTSSHATAAAATRLARGQVRLTLSTVGLGTFIEWFEYAREQAAREEQEQLAAPLAPDAPRGAPRPTTPCCLL